MKQTGILLVLMILLSEAAFSQIGVGRRRTQPTPQQSIDYSNPQEYEIAEITVAGNKGLDSNAIISLSGLSVGDKIRVPGPTISSAIKKLWKSRILGDVSISASKIEDGKIYLTINLAEKPRLSRIVLEGVNSSQESEINDDLTLIKGQIVDAALINRTRLTVQNFFIDKGYLNVEVDIQQQQDTLLNNAITLNIDVDKGDKVKIKRINFTGNEAISGKKLKGKMKDTNERVRFTLVKDLVNRVLHLKPKKVGNFITKQEDASLDDFKAYINEHVKLNFFNGSKFIRDDFKTDKQAIIDFYNSRGYRDAAIVSDSVYKSGPNTVSVDIEVDEGQKYYFRDIIWTGNYVYDENILARVLGIEKGDVYDMENLNKRLNFNPTGDDVSSLYMDNGYLFFNVQPVEVRIDQDSIDVEMRIYEGEQATISKIIITGNDRTNDHVIRREIRTLPGQKFSRSDLIRTQRELSQLGYFDPEQIGINPIPNPADGTVDIEYSLVEKPSDQIELSGGWGGYYGFVGTLGLVFNNFSVRNIPHFDRWRPLPIGDGQKLSLRVQANGRYFQSYSATFAEPWLGGKKPNNLTIGLSKTIVRRGGNLYNPYSYYQPTSSVSGSLKLTNLSVGLGRRLKWPDDYFTMSNSLVYRLYDINNYPILTNFNKGTSNNLALTNVIARNSIDNPMFPRTGSSISLEASFTPPFSVLQDLDYTDPITGSDIADKTAERYKWLEYHRWMFDAKHYTQLGKNLVLNTNIHFGFFGSYKDNQINTPFERFSLGGSGLAGQSFVVAQEIIGLRGYPDQSLQPSDEDGVRGGIAYNKFSAELRYLVSPNPAATIYVLGFVEGGNNFSDFNKYNPFDLYKSAGVGARIFMPAFGLLGIDWGYGFDTIDIPGLDFRPPGPEFHFRIGQQIR
uniref:POTRA domain-containing protein n=1 Tax=Roseihalotalea indica TaxID=2867963 RepID=A0AA49JGU1_9BACT|nr:POTRA domain-containing protein [Tunicatimonas sp. TK19036]